MIKYILLIFISIKIISSPWLESENIILDYKIQKAELLCDTYINPDIFEPYTVGNITKSIDEYTSEDFNIPNECLDELNLIKNQIKMSFEQPKTKVGFQSAIEDIYFQNKGPRYYQKENIYLQHSKASSRFAYNFKILKEDGSKDLKFDESYASILLKNNIVSVGRISRWWSPSDTASLILSNTARPSFGIEISNFFPFEFRGEKLKKLGKINYSFFINELEKDRAIPNTLLFGNRISLQPKNNLNISFFRIAQFGGRGRPTDRETIINMLIGRDNSTNKNEDFNEPGNQLAGIDLKYSSSNGFSYFIQMVGEDEAGYFPSRKMYLYGFSKKLIKAGNLYKFSFDFYDTETDINNYTYNHNIYKDGFRYNKSSIGANIDADSQKFKVSAELLDDRNNQIKIGYIDAVINRNNSEYNMWGIEMFKLKELNISFIKKYHKYHFELVTLLRDSENSQIASSNVFLKFEYKLN